MLNQYNLEYHICFWSILIYFKIFRGVVRAFSLDKIVWTILDIVRNHKSGKQNRSEQVISWRYLLLPNLSELLSIFGCPKLGDHILHISALMFKVNMTLIFGNPRIN